MNKFWIGLWLTGILVNSIVAQPEAIITSQPRSVAAFNTLLRDVDLNTNTQNGYAITKSEYALLLNAWNNLPQTDKVYMLYGEGGWKDFAKMLLLDIFMATSWQVYVRNAARYGAKGFSITVSRRVSPITLKRARQTLVDLLHKGPHMFVNGQLALTDQIKTQAKERAGYAALERLNKWEKLINSYQNHPDRQKLRAVNDFFESQIEAATDWGAAKRYDYWQSPIETLVRGKGDCDDFAMAKYISLRLLGIPTEQLRMAVVMHPRVGGHGVVFFYPLREPDPWVLDNLIPKGLELHFRRIYRLSLRKRLDKIKPLWGMNENIFSEFNESLNETVTLKNPREVIPQFATALVNSQRLLPRDEYLSLAHANATSETWGAEN